VEQANELGGQLHAKSSVQIKLKSKNKKSQPPALAIAQELMTAEHF